MSNGESLINRMLSKLSMKKKDGDLDEVNPEDFEIVVLEGDEPEKIYTLSGGKMTIGRLLASDKRKGYILIHDKTKTVSSNQADLLWDEKIKRHTLQPRKTTNPTRVNEKEIKKFSHLKPEDTIEIGKVVLKYQVVISKPQEKPEIVIPEEKYVAPSPEPSEVSVTQPDLSPVKQEKTEPQPSSSRNKFTSTDSLLPDESNKYLLDEQTDTLLDEDEPKSAETVPDDEELCDETSFSEITEGFEFLVQEGPDLGNVFPISINDIDNLLTIGYKGARRSDMELNDSSLDDIHASIKYESDNIILRLVSPRDDLHVNGFSLKEKILQDNDIIKLGNTVLKFRDLNIEKEKIELEILVGELKGKIYPLDKNEFRIGRKSKKSTSFVKDLEIPSSDRTVSRKHATIIKHDNHFFIKNESKKSITLVNGVQVMEDRLLKNGDKIKIGESVVFIFRRIAPLVPEMEDEDVTIAPKILQEKAPVPASQKSTLDVEDYFPEGKVEVGNKSYVISPDKLADEQENEEFIPETKEIVQNEIEGSYETLDLVRNDSAFHSETLEIEQQQRVIPPTPDGISPQEDQFVPQVVSEEKDVKHPHREPRFEDMIFVEEGLFWMGSSEDHEGDMYPLHEVYTLPYYIDVFPVTNLEFKRFILDSGYRSEGDWESAFSESNEFHPVVNVTFNDASAYAEWSGKRLPTEAEWEKAARGTDKRKYPWGNNWSNANLNSKDSELKLTTPIETYPSGKSYYGAMDMLGNVWEWTSSSYGPYPNTGNLDIKDSGKTLRGGSWVNILRFSGVTIRFEALPNEFGPDVGFRCVKDV